MLRDYQIRVIDETRDKLRKFNRVLIQLPTGGGKTACAAYIIKSALEKSKRSLFLAHRQEIAYQASATLKKFGVPHGFIMSSEPYSSSEFVQIGMIETVRRRLSKLSGIDVVIVDEAHHSTSNSWKKVIDFFCSAGAKTVGLSATPQRLDGKGLIDIFDDIVIGPSVKDLICSANLAPYKYYAPPAVANLDGIKKKFGEFDQQMLAERLDRPQVFGDAISHYKNIIPGKKAIAFHINIQASKNFTLQCLESGIVCRHVDGTMRPSERSEILESLRTEILRY